MRACSSSVAVASQAGRVRARAWVLLGPGRFSTAGLQALLAVEGSEDAERPSVQLYWCARARWFSAVFGECGRVEACCVHGATAAC